MSLYPQLANTTMGAVATEHTDLDLADGVGPHKDESDEDISPDEVRRPSQAVPAQKRRRVTRACDECRRKKIKCDGHQPCTHCTVYSYECTYDQPSQRRRNPGPAYIEALEQKLQRAEALLRTYDPTIDLNDASLDANLSKSLPGGSQFKSKPSSFSQSRTSSSASHEGPNKPPMPSQSSDDSIESMVRAAGQLDLDGRGQWEYYGMSSGLGWLRRLRDEMGEGSDTDVPRSDTIQRGRELGQDFVNPSTPPDREDMSFNFSQRNSAIKLPSRQVALKLCESALDDASAILNIVHQPTFYRGFNRIYDMPSNEYQAEDNRFLPLLYAVIALGTLFDKHDDSALEQSGYPRATHNGYEYFWAAKNLLDLTDCRDLVSLQAIIFMIMFLQCSAKLSTCYSYVGIALRCALRMGLHRSFRDGFSPIEAEQRKRVFWVIRKFDIYVGAMLGLPLTVNQDDIDQDLPTEVDDDHITEQSITPMPKGVVPIAAASNANFRLALILSKIVKSIYPIKGLQHREESSPRSYCVSYATIRELENDLQNWMENLPPELKPGGVRQPNHSGPIQQLLRLAYAHAQMMLYRPFLHYVSSRKSSKSVDSRSYACAAACISVSRNIIHITVEMMREGYLVGSYWFTMYTTFFAVLSLLFYSVENAESNTAIEILRDATAGREALAKLAKRSMAADRCSATLNGLWEALPERLASSQSTPRATSRKREAPEGYAQDGTMAPPPVPNQRQKASARASAPGPALSQTSSTRPTIVERRSGNFGSAMFIPQLPSASRSSSSSSTARQPMQQHAAQQLQSVEDVQRRQSYPQQTSSQQMQHPHQQQQQPQQQQGSYSMQRPTMQTYNGSLTDLSALMFPSADPFAYPIPPMTALEQNAGWGPSTGSSAQSSQPSDVSGHPGRSAHHQHTHHSGDGSHNSVPASTALATSVSADDHIDVQLFGPMLPYSSQVGFGHWDQQPAQHQQQQPRQFHPDQGSMTANSNPNMWEQMQGAEGLGYDDIFGSEAEWRNSMP